MEERLTPLLEQIDGRQKEQNRLLSFLRFSSPTILTQSLLSDIAETGNERHEHFLAELDDYIRKREAFFTAKFLRNENIYARDFDNLQTFNYRAEPLEEIMKRSILPLTGLLILSLSFTLFAAYLYGIKPIIKSK